MTRVLIINENELFGKGVEQILKNESDFKVSFLHLISLDQQIARVLSNYDIYILEITSSSLELANRILNINDKARIILLYDKYISHFNQFAGLGISGFIKKTTSISELLLMLQLVKHGHTLFPLSLLKQLIDPPNNLYTDNYRIDCILSKKEMEILQCIAAGKNNRKISEELFMSVRSVEYHLTKTFKKLNVNSRLEALSKAISLNLISINK